MLLNTTDGVKIQGELMGNVLGVSFRDADGVKRIDLTIEEAIDFVNAIMKSNTQRECHENKNAKRCNHRLHEKTQRNHNATSRRYWCVVFVP
jgi:hypothetical protein